MNERLVAEWQERQAQRKAEFTQRLVDKSIEIFRQAIREQMIDGTIAEYNEIKKTVFGMYRI